ncbi:hypothetical protein HDU82_005029 [Entophlyctis luteolus]|nr:hypothetical protein HDU82_005029 [Entophlyctis luteolus]
MFQADRRLFEAFLGAFTGGTPWTECRGKLRELSSAEVISRMTAQVPHRENKELLELWLQKLAGDVQRGVHPTIVVRKSRFYEEICRQFGAAVAGPCLTFIISHQPMSHKEKSVDTNGASYALVFVASAVAATSVGTYEAPGSTDVRSPCPGLNALANHGFLNRNGRGISALDIISAMDTGLGIGVDVGTLQIIGALSRGAFDFDLLKGGYYLQSFANLTATHNKIEHDASLTRIDQHFGDAAAINSTLVMAMLAHSSDGSTLTFDEIAAFRHERIKDTYFNNPQHTLNSTQSNAFWRENALIAMVLAPLGATSVRLDWLESWLLHEKLPFDLGWSPSSPGRTAVEMLVVGGEFEDKEKALNAATGDNIPLDFSTSLLT